MQATSPDAPPPPPLRPRLAVFARPRRPEDALPRALAELVESFDDALPIDEPVNLPEPEPRGVARLPLLGRAFRRKMDPKIKAELEAELEAMDRKHKADLGSHLPGESRLLLRDLGVERLHLYAVPTTTGQVGVYLGVGEGGIGGGWVAAALPEGISWQISFKREPGKPTQLVVFGLVVDEVAAVAVQLNGETRPAVLANNGFFYEAEGREPNEVTALILHEHTGETRRIPLEP